ncbi:unnamed protein product [marine sediment metagenome]|uniref:Uncharacterized protein n=1 Tax=marine sediment metagenome TaxID=412755 RepID=X0ZU51_9ZZZZ
MIHPNEINPFLMLDPGLNAIIAKSNTHIETTKKIMGHRLAFGATALYQNILAKMLEETTVVTMKKKKPVYPERKYLGNVIMNYLPHNHAWQITITNGGSTRKNAKLPLKIKETFYLRRLNGNYFVDRDFTINSKETRRLD